MLKIYFFLILGLELFHINFKNKDCNLVIKDGGIRYGIALVMYKNLGSKSILDKFILANHKRGDWERRLVSNSNWVSFMLRLIVI